METSKAQDAASRKDFALAKERLCAAYSILSEKMPSYVVPFEMNMLASQIGIGVEDGPLALAAATTARAQIFKDNKLRSLDKEYLTRYCDLLVHYCNAWRYGYSERTLPSISIAHFGEVSSIYKKSYPLPASGYFV